MITPKFHLDLLQPPASTKAKLEAKEELQKIREASLKASRKGDYMRVAKLTSRAASLNNIIRGFCGGDL